MGKVLSLTNKDIIETLLENNPELLASIMDEIEKQFQEEVMGTVENPKRRELFSELCEKLRKTVEPLDGDVFIITPKDERCIRHYVDVNIPSDTDMNEKEFSQLLNCMKEFEDCHWEIEDNIITIGLTFTGIWEKKN